MKSTPQPTGDEIPVWISTLADFLKLEPGVEAVRLNQDEKKISVAAFQLPNVADLQEKLNAVLDLVDAESAAHFVSPGTRKIGALTLRQEGASLVLEKPSCPTAPKLWKWRQFAWPEDSEDQQTDREWKIMALQATICGLCLFIGWLLARFTIGPSWLPWGFYGASLIAGAWDAAKDAWEGLRQRQMDVHFLMLAVAAGAVSIGAWTEGCLLLFLFSASGAMEHFALHRTHREINSLTKSAPKTAHLLEADGSTHPRAVGLLRTGDLILVKPDEVFPADGRIRSGETSSDESNLTGESVPVSKKIDSEVFSGTLNLWGAVSVELTKPAKDSTAQNIIRLIRDAQHQRAPSQRFTDKFGTGYTLGILGLTAVMFFVWWLGFQLPAFENLGENKSAFYRAMALLVVASPCALVLSIPSAILAAIASGARRGILFRGGAAIEKLAEVDTVAMDKTGTLTTGEMVVQSVESFPPGREDEVAKIAFALEKQSNHPLARAIVTYCRSKQVPELPVSEFASLTGKGVRGLVDSKLAYLGRRELLQDGPLAEWISKVPDAPLAATEVWIIHGELLGRLLLQDHIREESRAVLAALKSENVRTIMLTGDRRSAAERVATELGVQEVRSGLKPEEKLEIITKLGKEGHKVAMVGDGVNDAPSLAAAYVAVAMGGRGSDAALEQADVALMNDRIDKFLVARTLSRRARGIIRQNLAISLGTVILMVGASLFGIVPLTLGVIAHEGSTVLVCLNSLRLLFAARDGS